MKTLGTAFSSDPNSIPNQLSSKFNLKGQDVHIDFINYGNTQMVYLATFENGKKLTTLINQPQIKLGEVKQEFENLKNVFNIDPKFVVEPYATFSMNETGHELYTCEYIDNAMCIAVKNNHGIYDPLPNYHFEDFSPEISREVNISMIEMLVHYYDSKKERGLAKTQVSGNDFMLTRNFDKKNLKTVRPNMKLIAARDFISTPFESYLDILRKEFLIGTNHKDKDVLSGKLKINTKSSLPLKKEEIEEGIKRGIVLRKTNI